MAIMAPTRKMQRLGASKQSIFSIQRILFFLVFVLTVSYIYICGFIAINIGTSGASPPAQMMASGLGFLSAPTNKKPIQIAYAISLIKCSDFQSSTSGLLDAATVLRHSVHETSVRNPDSGSKYDYKLYAIVHTNAAECSHILTDLGYEVLLKDSPVDISEIQGDYLRKNVHKEWCCGADEFVKLYAYTIEEHPIVVHTDIDFMFYQPMDDIYDAMLLPRNSEEGKRARSKVEMEYPDKDQPDNIQAYLTRDYHQVIPGRKSAFQAGFIVLKPSMEAFNEYLDIIREGNYVDGFSRENGWGGKGYGGVVGSMAMQGLPAYYYDIIRPNTTVELNGCRYNHMGANIFYDDVPNFISRYKDLHGKCRRNIEGCEDCRKTDLGLIKNIHFTNCRKPWNCAGMASKASTIQGGKTDPPGSIDSRTSNYEHCVEVVRKWHEMRTDLEQKIGNVTRDTKVFEGQSGDYKKHMFMGHCSEDGAKGYLPIAASREVMVKVAQKIWDVNG